MKITFQNQTIKETENRAEAVRTDAQRSKKSRAVNAFGAIYESGALPVAQ